VVATLADGVVALADGSLGDVDRVAVELVGVLGTVELALPAPASGLLAAAVLQLATAVSVCPPALAASPDAPDSVAGASLPAAPLAFELAPLWALAAGVEASGGALAAPAPVEAVPVALEVAEPAPADAPPVATAPVEPTPPCVDVPAEAAHVLAASDCVFVAARAGAVDAPPETGSLCVVTALEGECATADRWGTTTAASSGADCGADCAGAAGASLRATTFCAGLAAAADTGWCLATALPWCRAR
jgi:hypothetical protein